MKTKDIYEALFEHVSEDENIRGIILNIEDFKKIPAAPQLGTPGYYMDPMRQYEIIKGAGVYGQYMGAEYCKTFDLDSTKSWPRLDIMVSKEVKPGQYIVLDDEELKERIDENCKKFYKNNKEV